MKTTLSFLFLLITVGIYGQSLWLTPKLIDDNSNLINAQTNKTFTSNSPVKWVNYNPVYTISEETIVETIPNNSGISFFAVYQAQLAQKEQHVFSLFNSNQNIAVLTDQRMADFQKGRFSNFLNFEPNKIKLTSFTSNTIIDSDFQIKLGGKANKQDLPIIPMQGFIGDVIIYSKAISPITKEIIESTLSLKYGIPLSKFSKYKNALGKTILDLSKTNFGNNVGGIGKIEALFFNQKQSSSIIKKGSLSIANQKLYKNNIIHPLDMNENTFLIWSDNNESIVFNKTSSENYRIDRTWEIINHRIDPIDQFQLKVNEPILNEQLITGEALWLRFQDDVGIKYSPLDKNGLSESLWFSNFTNMNIYKAPKSWVAIDTNSSDCSATSLGSARIELFGTLIGMDISLYDFSGRIIFQEYKAKKIISLDQLLSGKYTIELSQNGQLKKTTNFYINDLEIEKISMPSRIIIQEKKDYFFNANNYTHKDYSYEWKNPEGIILYSSKIKFNLKGVYELIISNNNCQSIFLIDVIFPEKEFKAFNVYPNPSSTGQIWWEIDHFDEGELEISIYDLLGNEIFTEHYQSAIFHQGHFFYPHNGLYIITARSGKTIQSSKVNIQKPQ